jgi:hypothetical protein
MPLPWGLPASGMLLLAFQMKMIIICEKARILPHVSHDGPPPQ